jgi:hypothetical protein
MKRVCQPLPAPSSTTARAAGSTGAESIDFLLAIRSRRNSLRQEAPDLVGVIFIHGRWRLVAPTMNNLASESQIGVATQL